MPATDNDILTVGFTGECHPEVLEFPCKEKRQHKEGQLTEEQLFELKTKGFIVVRNVLDKSELQEVQKDIEEMVDRLAEKLFSHGKITKKYQDLGFYKRLIAIEKECPGANIMLHKGEGSLSPAMKSIAAHPKILNMLEDLIGPDIAFNPVWNLRTKTPNNEATTVPWHQDNGYFDHDCYNLMIPTCWIPLIDANMVNGTLEMLPGCHSKGLVAEHNCCFAGTWYVMLDEEEIQKRFNIDLKEKAEIVPVPYGSLLLFNNFTPHRSLNNLSDNVRWSLDFRWQKAGTPGGLYGLKQPCVLRLNGKNIPKPDWESFDSVDRSKVQNEAMQQSTDQFDTTISGPWMKKWLIVNHNRHTDAFNADPNTWDPNVTHG